MQNAAGPDAANTVSASPSQSTPPARSDKSLIAAPFAPLAPPGAAPRELGGPPGPEPTRFGDWEKKGRCIDF